jgi:hypothetical protein
LALVAHCVKLFNQCDMFSRVSFLETKCIVECDVDTKAWEGSTVLMYWLGKISLKVSKLLKYMGGIFSSNFKLGNF